MKETLGKGPLPSGRHSLPREFVVASQRDRLIDAMAACCSEKRYAEVSVADIVGRARVSRSTFYSLFPDKEACFLAAYDEILGQFIAEVIRASRNPGDPWEDQLESGLKAGLDFMAAEPYFARMCIVDVFSAGPAALERYLSTLRVIANFINEHRDRSGSRGQIPDATAFYLLSGAAVLIRARIVEDRIDFLPEIGPDILYGVLVPYMEQSEAADRASRYSTEIA